ncbi:MAG: GNAT family N-acetyltransferase [Pseudonocardiales bacterium]
MTVVPWGPADLRRHIDAALDIYCAAMGYPPSTGRQRKGYVVVHTQRPGFLATGALDKSGTVIGFAYGYQGAPGQWWHDEVRRGLGEEQVARWLTDPFEVCELHVRPDHQGHGIGQELLTRLLDGCPHATVVLSTPEGESRAWGLYRRLSFVDIRRSHRFAGDGRRFAVLGRTLPLEHPTVRRDG